MKDEDIFIFVQRMKEIGDLWDYEDVQYYFSNCTLEEAIERRITELKQIGFSL